MPHCLQCSGSPRSEGAQRPEQPLRLYSPSAGAGGAASSQIGCPSPSAVGKNHPGGQNLVSENPSEGGYCSDAEPPSKEASLASRNKQTVGAVARQRPRGKVLSSPRLVRRRGRTRQGPGPRREGDGRPQPTRHAGFSARRGLRNGSRSAGAAWPTRGTDLGCGPRVGERATGRAGPGGKRRERRERCDRTEHSSPAPGPLPPPLPPSRHVTSATRRRRRSGPGRRFLTP